MILDFIKQNEASLCFATMLKPLIAQYSDTDAELVDRLVTLISQVQWNDRKTMLKCMVHLTKLNKQVQLFGNPPTTLDRIIAESATMDEALCAKLSFLAILR